MSTQPEGMMDKTLGLIFRPVAKLLIKNNVPLQTAVEFLKRALVRSAATDPKMTDSLVSLRTGLHRKDVKRLRASGAEAPVKKIPISPISVVMTHWAQDPAFVDESHAPRALNRNHQKAEPGFDQLVKASRVDLPPATVLAELKQQGLVEIQADGRIALLSTTYLPQTKEASLEAFDATISDHIRIAVENATSAAGTPKQFDQVLRYSHLSEASVAELEAKARQQGRAYLEELNQLAHKLQMDDAANGLVTNGRFVTGVFIAPVHGGSKSDKQEQEDQ